VRNEHFKFHKVVSRYYSGEVVNVYIILQQIYSEIVYQLLLESPEFYRFVGNILFFFSGHSVV